MPSKLCSYIFYCSGLLSFQYLLVSSPASDNLKKLVTWTYVLLIPLSLSLYVGYMLGLRRDAAIWSFILSTLSSLLYFFERPTARSIAEYSPLSSIELSLMTTKLLPLNKSDSSSHIPHKKTVWSCFASILVEIRVLLMVAILMLLVGMQIGCWIQAIGAHVMTIHYKYHYFNSLQNSC